jgi:hypothetical protein
MLNYSKKFLLELLLQVKVMFQPDHRRVWHYHQRVRIDVPNQVPSHCSASFCHFSIVAKRIEVQGE